MSNVVRTPESAPTMTSLELVEFINSQRAEGESELRHDNFMAKVPKVLGENHALNFKEMVAVTIGSGATRQSPIYRFPKREACLMAMSYSYELQAKVYDRMTALENGAAPAINLRDPKQLAAAALQLIEVNAELQSKVDAQQRQIEEAAPKVEALNRLALADGSLCIRDAAKTLGIQEIKLKRILQERGWIYRRPTGAGWLAYSEKLQSGLMEHKVTTGQKGDGSEWINTQPRVTAKGLTRLVEAVQQGAMH